MSNSLPSASRSVINSPSPALSISPHAVTTSHSILTPAQIQSPPAPASTPLSLLPSHPQPMSQDQVPLASTATVTKNEQVPQDESAVHRRRRDVRAARDRLGEQFDHLRHVLPDPPPGVELSAKAQVLEHSLDVIQRLMKRVTDLAMELAVVTPEATRRWVRNTADDGRKPFLNTVVLIMKLFAARRQWRYAEWWTLDEKRNADDEDIETNADTYADDVEKPAGVVDDPSNVHGCVVRDTISVMRLGWTLIQRSPDTMPSESTKEALEAESLTQFARVSQNFEFRPRVGMPGRVWTSRRAEWLINLEDHETFIRSPVAEKFGMKTCLAVPIQFGGHVHSVMAFYSREARTYSPECYDLVCLLAQSLEEVYSPRSSGPWHLSPDPLFAPRGR